MAEKKTKPIRIAPKKMATTAKAENQYEAMFLFPPPGVVDVEGMIAIARGILERHGGKVMLIKKWDERKLAYEVKRQKRGLYIISYFTAPGSAITAIERDVNLSEDVLRVLVTSAGHLNLKEMEAVEPQPIQPREDRAPWDRPDFNRPIRRDDRGPRREDGAPVEAGAGFDKD